MAWILFNWGSRGLHYKTEDRRVYVATVLIDRCVQLNLRGTDAYGNELLHVFHAITPTAPVTYDDCLTLASTVEAWCNDVFKGLIPTTFDIRDVVATARDVLEGPQATVAIGIAGTRAGDPAPGSVTLALKKAGLIAARYARGRFYSWPPVTTDYAENIFTDDYAGDCVSTYTALISAIDGAGYALGIASTSHHVITPVSAIVIVDQLVDNQRRRLSGRGS